MGPSSFPFCFMKIRTGTIVCINKSEQGYYYNISISGRVLPLLNMTPVDTVGLSVRLIDSCR